MKKNVSIFISDEGYGHTIRQRTIIKELLKRKKFGKITVFHEKNIKLLKETFNKKINYYKIYNSIKMVSQLSSIYAYIDKINGSKFFAGLILLSSINTFSNASELSTYIERNINYDKLIINIIESHENIRTRKTNLIK